MDHSPYGMCFQFGLLTYIAEGFCFNNRVFKDCDNMRCAHGPLTRVDQMDEAIDYIKSLETRVKMAQEKKESLMKTKRPRSEHCSSASQSPEIEIREMGSSLQIILTCGFDEYFIFKEVIRILNEENLDIKSAHSSLAGNSMLHIMRAEQSFQVGKTSISERLERLIDGHR
ncbi:hypothetical protein VNO77_28499 [Canavalia gladiata]|uniref:Uncharacterized protein n=1 Tax=Canavalia gladiata TaxID=3824 RepID=A0AAN9KYD7_CANGL